MIGAGFTIQAIGTTRVFVPTDLTFMGLDRGQLDSINPALSRSLPTTAQDLAGRRHGRPPPVRLCLVHHTSRSLWQAC